MTGLYLTAAVLALVWAGYTAARLRRDRSALVVASLLCMASAAATMGIAAVWPELMWAGPAHPFIAWLLVSLGLLATWTFLGVLAAVTGQTARPLALVAVPLAAAAAGGLILAGVPRAWAVGPAPDAWGIPALASQGGDAPRIRRRANRPGPRHPGQDQSSGSGCRERHRH